MYSTTREAKTSSVSANHACYIKGSDQHPAQTQSPAGVETGETTKTILYPRTLCLPWRVWKRSRVDDQ
jgi:NADH:ubiquinone oxidoreductase subunit E